MYTHIIPHVLDGITEYILMVHMMVYTIIDYAMYVYYIYIYTYVYIYIYAMEYIVK